MRRLLLIGIGSCVMLGAPDIASACGFKVSGSLGAVRFDNVRQTPNPIGILAYRNTQSKSAKKVLTPTLERVLAKVGHHFHIVDDEAEFSRYISRGEWPCEVHGRHQVEAVVVDIEDANKLGGGSRDPVVLPIVEGPKQYNRERRKKYPVILTNSARPAAHLPAIEKVARKAGKRSGKTMVAAAPRAASSEDRRSALARAEDRQPVRTGGARAEETRVAVGSGRESAAPAPAPAREAVAAAPVAKAEPAPEPEPKPVAKAEPKPAPEPAPVAKAEPTPAARKFEPAAAIASAPVRTKRKVETIERKVELDTAPAPKASVEVLFATNSKRVRSTYARRLRKHVKWLKSDESRRIRIEGHTDTVGPSEYNLSLGTKRAEAVQFWFEDQGISSDRIETVSYGEERPKYSPGSNGKNRRAVVARVE